MDRVSSASSSLPLITFLILFPLGCTQPSGDSTTAKSGVNSESEEVDPAFVIPNGTPAEVLDFVKQLRERRPQISSQSQWVEHMVKTQKALIRAGDKIMKQDVDDPTLREAVTVKLMGHMGLAALENELHNASGDSAKKALAVVNELRRDKREAVAGIANEFWLAARSINLRTMTVAERSQLSDEMLEKVAQNQASQESLGDAGFLAEQFEKLGDNESAASIYDRIANSLDGSDNSRMKSFAVQYRGKANRARLPGNQIALEGKLLNGGDLDWESYRGKVVLIDFWATWCGPCLQELPNVKANYQQFHDRGFDVVGISLDRDRSALEGYLKKNPLPWAQLFDGDNALSKGWQHPMAVRYGVSSIPSAFLVGKDGKVVSLEARGPDLNRLIKELLGSEG